MMMTHSERLELIGQIIDCIEDWLDSKGIVIPNPDKEQDMDGVNIYAADYDTLSNGIEGTLINWGLLGTKMTVREFLAKDVDIDVMDDYTDELCIAYVGPTTLTPEGEAEFRAALDLEIAIHDSTAKGYFPVAVVHIPEGEHQEGLLRTAERLFHALAGYCADDDYQRWFVED